MKPQLALRYFLIVTLVMGVWFRFTHLDQKVYWYDEAFTSLRAAGYTEAEVVQHFAIPDIAPVADLQRYQQPAPGRTMVDTIHSLAMEDPQHPPLYYSMTAVWMRWVGSSLTAMRLLPALLSLLMFPCIYWLCDQLFVKSGDAKSNLAGWIGMALMAVSPFQVVYAQESRQYGLWSVMVVMSTALLLRALRQNRWQAWALYALALSAAFYTFLLTATLAIAHGTAVLILSKFRLSSRLVAYVTASVVAIVAFIPWIWAVFINFSQAQRVTDWTNEAESSAVKILGWLGTLRKLFAESDLRWLNGVLGLAALLLAVYAFHVLSRQCTLHTKVLVWCCAVMPWLILALPDLILGGRRSLIPRYLIPALLGIQVAVIYLFTVKLTPSARLHTSQPKWRAGLALLISVGILSCSWNAQQTTTWSKIHNQSIVAIAQQINTMPRPLIVSDAETGDLLALSHHLDSKVQLLIQPHCYTCSLSLPAQNLTLPPYIPSGYNVFLYQPRPPATWLQDLANQITYTAKALIREEETDALWQLTPRS